MGPALVVYLCIVEDGGVVDWAGSTGSVGACDSHVVWVGEEGLQWAWDEDLCLLGF